MADTPILGITELADGQVNQFATANQAFQDLEAASNAQISIDLSAGNATVSAAQFTRNFLFVTSGNAVSRNLTVLATKRIFAVRNGGSATLNLVLGSTTVTIAASKTRLCATDGTTNGLVILDLT